MENKVSVIIPTYRRFLSLERALRSVIGQSYKNTEIVIVDDNGTSSEYSQKVKTLALQLRTTYSNLVYLKNPTNVGAANSRNIGIQVSTGDYITFLDDDDIYKPDKIRLQVTYMTQNGLDMCFSDLVLKNENDRLVDIRARRNLTKFDTETLLKYHLMYHITGTGTFMYKRALLERLSGFDSGDIGDEFYLMLKTIKSGARIGYLPGCHVIAYVHDNEGGLSTSDKKIEGENSLYLHKKTYFETMSGAERRIIKFRHYLVLSHANFKKKNYFNAIVNGIKALLISPASVAFYTTYLIKVRNAIHDH